MHPDTTVDKELDHDKFQRLVDEASDELWRARGMRLIDDTWMGHITLDEEVPIAPVDELQDIVTVDEVPERSSDESDSECMSYEEYLCIYGAVEDERPGQTAPTLEADSGPSAMAVDAAENAAENPLSDLVQNLVEAGMPLDKAEAMRADLLREVKLRETPRATTTPREVKEECAVASNAVEACEYEETGPFRATGHLEGLPKVYAKNVRENWQGGICERRCSR